MKTTQFATRVCPILLYLYHQVLNKFWSFPVKHFYLNWNCCIHLLNGNLQNFQMIKLINFTLSVERFQARGPWWGQLPEMWFGGDGGAERLWTGGEKVWHCVSQSCHRTERGGGQSQIIRDFSLQASNYVLTMLCSLMINSPLGRKVIKTSLQKSLDWNSQLRNPRSQNWH